MARNVNNKAGNSYLERKFLDRKGICSLEEFVLYQLATKVLESRLKITIETHAYILIQSTCSTKLIISLFFKTEKSNVPILDENY